MAISIQLRQDAFSILSFYAGTACLVFAGFYSITHGETSLLLGAMALFPLLAAYSLDKSLGICATLLFLILLGDIRRITGLLVGYAGNDPLLLVGVLFSIVAAAPIFLRLRLKDNPSKLAFGLLVISILQIFNPAQGSLLAGFSAATICLPPLLWFWIGRSFGNEKMIGRVIYGILIPAAVLASLVGFYQTFVGVLPWQQEWVDRVSSTYTALHIGKSIRAFGFSTSGSEYQNLLMMATMCCIAAVIAGRRLLAAPLIVLLPGIILASSRTSILRVLLSGALAFAFSNRRKGTAAVRFVTGLAIGIGGIAVVLSQYGDYKAPTRGATAVDYAIAHQANGLAHPLDKHYSTAGVHGAEITYGFEIGFRSPLGLGLASSNIAGAKFGAAIQAGSEFDLSDAFIQLGLPGGVMYLVFVFTMIIVGFRYTRVGPRSISLPIAAMLPALVGNWTFPGEWANGPLFFFLMGCMIHRMYPAAAPELAARRPRFADRGRSPIRPVAMPPLLPSLEPK
jgi:hypothetical protein